MGERNQQWKELFGAEWEKIYDLSRCFSDPEQQAEFLQTAKEKKLADDRWSIEWDYPSSETATEKAKRGFFEAVKRFRKTGDGA